MADFVAATLLSSVLALKSKIEQAINLPEECRKVVGLLTVLSSVVPELESKLMNKNHRDLVEQLRKALQDIESVVDYVADHPMQAKFLAGKYLQQLDTGINAVNQWITNLQLVNLSLTSSMIENLATLQENTTQFIHEIQCISHGVDDVRRLQKMTLEASQSCLLEIRSMTSKKSGRYQQFLDEEDSRMLQLLETKILKESNMENDGFLCPISFCVMEEPVMVTSSGFTYDKKSLNEHIANCYRDGRVIFDPLTKNEFDPKNHIVPNRALANSIECWRKSLIGIAIAKQDIASLCRLLISNTDVEMN